MHLLNISSQISLEKKRTFVRFVSHEIRTPLNIVHMGLKYLQREISNINMTIEEKHQVIRDIQGSLETSLDILNDLLNYEKLDAGIMKLELEPLSVWPLIRDTFAPFFLQVNKCLWNTQFPLKISRFPDTCVQAAEAGVELSFVNRNNLKSILQNILIKADRTKIAKVRYLCLRMPILYCETIAQHLR